MKTIKTVFKKVAKKNEKVELATQKVELSLVDDMSGQAAKANAFVDAIDKKIKSNDKLWDEAFKLEKKFLDLEEKARKQQDKIASDAKKASKLIASMDKLWDRLSNTAKELGINPRDTKGYDKWDSAYDDLNGIERKVNEFK